jgi:hypothetical protein
MDDVTQELEEAAVETAAVETPVSEETPAEETPVEELAAAEETAKEQTKEAETPAEPPAETAQADAPPAEEKPEDDATELRKQVNELAAQLAAAKNPQPQPQEGQEPAAGNGPIEFINQDEFDGLFSDRAKLNEKLTTVFNAAVQQAVQAIPQIAASQVDWRIYTVTARERFYQANPDLVQYDTYLGQVINQLAAKDPSKPFHELLSDAEPIVRQQLRLPKQQAADQPGALPQRTEVRPRAALPTAGSARQGGMQAPVVRTISDEIEALRDV